jgi:hypothetical protein
MKIILLVDALINFALGVLLVIFSPAIANRLGIPLSSTSFYPNILGAIFIGITIALLIDAIRKKGHGNMGLGLLGAISINLCGGTMLAIWLIFGDLRLPARGLIILWTLVVILVIVSVTELIHFGQLKKNVRSNNISET